jgi:Ubiquitin-like domain
MTEILSPTSFVKVNVSNSQNDAVSFEKKFDKNLTIAELKVSHRQKKKKKI